MNKIKKIIINEWLDEQFQKDEESQNKFLNRLYTIFEEEIDELAEKRGVLNEY